MYAKKSGKGLISDLPPPLLHGMNYLREDYVITLNGPDIPCFKWIGPRLSYSERTFSLNAKDTSL